MTIILLILSVLIGVFLGKYFGSKQQFAKNLLILSAGFLITICLNEVFPEVYHSEDHNIGIFVIIGVLIQMLLENLTKGFEHGHLHHHADDQTRPRHRLTATDHLGSARVHADLHAAGPRIQSL